MTQKILIIDDDPDLSMLLQTRLESNGYNVVVAHDGSEGITKCSDEKPDLIIMDVRMPQMDGWTALHQLRKSMLGKSIPILMTTAQHNLQSMFEAEGVTGFITKPYDQETLLQKVKSALEVK